MTRIRVLAVAALCAVLVLGSCGFGPVEQMGSVTLSLPAAGAKVLGDSIEVYRISVFVGQDVIKEERVEATGTTQTISLTEVPVGSCTFLVSRGEEEIASGDFYPTHSGELTVTIIPGENDPGDVTLYPVPFTAAADMRGETVNGLVVASDGTVAVSTPDKLYTLTYDSETGTFSAAADGPAVGPEINSLSLGKVFGETDGFVERVFVNTTWTLETGGGILPWDLGVAATGEAALDEDFTAAFDSVPGEAADAIRSNSDPVSVLRSGTYAYDAEEGETDWIAVYFQRDGGLGGIFLTRDEWDNVAGDQPPETWPWIVDQIDLSAQLGELLAEGEEPVLDFLVIEDALYMVSKLFTFKLSSELLDVFSESSSDEIMEQLLDPESGYVGFAPGESLPLIRSLGYDGTRVYVGTENGLWYGNASESRGEFVVPGSLTTEPVSGTRGRVITRIAVSPSGDYVAFVSKRSGVQRVNVLDTALFETTSYQALHGIPGTAFSQLWWLSDEVLLVAGNRGLAALSLAAEAE
jgi:hypothetical protein